MLRFKHVLVISGCLFYNSVSAQVDTAKKNIADTIRKDLLTAPDTVVHLHSKTAALIPPAALVAYGAASFIFHPVRQLDHDIYGEITERNLLVTSHTENILQFGPVILVYGLNLAGDHGKNTFIDRTMTYVLAQGMMNLALFTLKRTTHRLRPDGSNYYSFPSGHTANAFAGAEFMAQEYSGKSPWYGVGGYSLAVTTGVLRMYHKDHWFSDVIAGAGFGILATKGAYLLYPIIRNNLFHGKEKADKKASNALLLPSYEDGALGLQFSKSF